METKKLEEILEELTGCLKNNKDIKEIIISKTNIIIKRKRDQEKKLNHILLITCITQKVSIEAIKSKVRLRKVTDSRFIYYYISRKITRSNLEEIGSLVNRDHSTVIHGIKQVENIKMLKEAADNIINKYF